MNGKSMQLVAVALVAMFIGSQVSTDGTKAQDDAKPAVKAEAKKTPKKPRGRLPNYYSKVVTAEQRESIYKLQSTYNGQIGELKKQIEELTKKRDDEVRGVLSPEQQKQVDELAAAAKKAAEEKRKSKNSDKTKTSEKS